MSAVAWAQEAAYAVDVELSTGEAVRYTFAQQPVVTFPTEGMMNITTGAEGDSRYYVISDVVRMSVVSVSVGVDKVTTQGKTVEFSMDGDVIYASNLASGTVIRIFTAGGRLVAETSADDEGRAGIDVRSLDRGVYVMSAGKVSFKFMR